MIKEIKDFITNNKTLIATLSIITAVIFWGMSFVSMRMLINTGIPPYTMISIRYLLVSACLFFILISGKKSYIKDLTLQDHKFFMISGATGITAYFLFEAKGISLTTASSASIIIAMIPVFTLITELIFFKKKYNLFQIIGISLSILGVFLIIYSTSKQQNIIVKNPMLGNILMLGACLSWVGYSVFSKKLHTRFSSLKITTMQSFYGTIFLIPFAFIERANWVSVKGFAWLNLLFLAIFCSVLSYYLYNLAIRILGITIISVYINLIPLVGFLGGVFILHESINSIQIIGCLIIVVSLFLVNKRPKGLIY
jgi:drug/metabolite transporter (DMT)-like permease